MSATVPTRVVANACLSESMVDGKARLLAPRLCLDHWLHSRGALTALENTQY